MATPKQGCENCRNRNIRRECAAIKKGIVVTDPNGAPIPQYKVKPKDGFKCAFYEPVR